MRRAFILPQIVTLLACKAPASPPSQAPPAPPAAEVSTPSSALSDDEIQAIVGAEDRDAEDQHTDARRRPADFLRFAKLERGMRVADIGAGGGYTTELLVRAVGPQGTVYGQNSPFVLERFAEGPWSTRLEKPLMTEVVRLDRPFDDPFPDDVRDLDLVVNVLFYHDFGWMGVDRKAHLRDAFEALRPGGRYIVIDASAQSGVGDTQGESLHRIEESLVRHEFESVGFVLSDESDAWRNPSDTREWNAPPWRNDRDEFSDKFALEFTRPAE